MEKGKVFLTKQSQRRTPAHSARIRRATVSCSTPAQQKKELFYYQEHLSDSSSNFSDQESDPTMTKDTQISRIQSEPIRIPQLKISEVKSLGEKLHSFHRSPANSIGDSVYHSPNLPRSSKDFDDVMVNLKHQSEVKRVQSCDDVETMEIDMGSRKPHSFQNIYSSSLPAESIVPEKHGRRTVHFDETTITTTADLGESAARFRMLWRKKRGLVALPCPRFGESRTITVQHEDEEEVPSPQAERRDKNKSIFDVCNYSSYGRYT